MRKLFGLLVLATQFACQTVTLPGGHVTGVVVTRDDRKPIANAYVTLFVSIPVGIDASPIQQLASVRSRADGSWEMEVPVTRVRVNYAEMPVFGMSVLHPDHQAVGHFFDRIPAVPVVSPLAPRPPGGDPVDDDCQELCISRGEDQCREVALEYFGAEDVCAFRY